jgi:valyl-tRNA synthetase
MSQELSKQYDPKAVEATWYQCWLERGYFHADVDPARPAFCITIPPPNVTGELHMGHALQHSIHDLIIRWKRMQGLNTLCLPGTDHASISTQMKVVQQLRSEGIDWRALGREKFLERCWQWTEKYGGAILGQLKSLGCSYDWRRTRFTLDDGYYRAVLTAFVHFYERGWVYRGLRVVNWCPTCQTTVSDLEVEHKPVDSHLWHIRYPAEDGGEGVVVATTRPETMLGDTAVAVNPADDRYRSRVGTRVRLPLMERLIPIVADDFVDREFGTGAVKVTPAHDPNDFEIGQRHGLPSVVVIDPERRMTAEAGRFAGLEQTEARKQVVAALEEQGLLVGTEPYQHQVGHHDKCGTLLEPLAMEQWFVRMRELADLALKEIHEGRVTFTPERFRTAEVQWLEKIRDWNISRQLWWGQRIPVWTCEGCGEVIVQVEAPAACPKCGAGALTQDPDVFDTWFSSALWPFATLGWPEETPELSYFYPTDLMITGRDILFLWIARMMYCSEEFLGKEPFRRVLVHPTVQNHEGKRMSKSLGTGIDPLDLTAEYGTDATRFGLVYQCGGSQDIRFQRDRLEMCRNFCTKLWNVSRFVLMNLGDQQASVPSRPPGDLELADRFILSRLEKAVAAVNGALDRLAVDEAAQRIYSFVWDELCDVYVERAKPRLALGGTAATHVREMLLYVLERSLRLAHPFMPFITEEIWQRLPHQGETIMKADYPKADDAWFDGDAERLMSQSVIEHAQVIRNVRATYEMKGSEDLPFRTTQDISDETAQSYLEQDVRGRLIRDSAEWTALSAESFSTSGTTASGAVVDVLIPRTDTLRQYIERERGRLERQIASVDKELARTTRKLSDPNFRSRALRSVVEEEERIHQELEHKKAELKVRLKDLPTL